MNILILYSGIIPALKYGGTERVVWDLGKSLAEMGHKVFYLVGKGSHCPFAEKMYVYDPAKELDEQIPPFIDVVHSHLFGDEIRKPHIVTLHGNAIQAQPFDLNTVFISANHAKRFNGSVYVHNGLDWDSYAAPELAAKRAYFHFLGRAAWKVKNLAGAIRITREAGEKLYVLGGYRINLKMGIRITFDTHVRFKGMVDNEAKSHYLNHSKGLLFPVLWHEPFGLAIIESLYFGCPVFGTTYGSLPELVHSDVGYLSNSDDELAEALKSASSYNRNTCHEYARTQFSSLRMAKNYVALYEKVVGGETLHQPHRLALTNEEAHSFLLK